MTEEHWAADCGHVRIQRYAKQGLMLLRGEAGEGRAWTKGNDCGEPGCQEGHQASCAMSGRKIEKGCVLESGILRQLGRRRRRRWLSGRPKCAGRQRGDLKGCGERRKGRSWMAGEAGWRSGQSVWARRSRLCGRPGV